MPLDTPICICTYHYHRHIDNVCSRHRRRPAVCSSLSLACSPLAVHICRLVCTQPDGGTNFTAQVRLSNSKLRGVSNLAGEVKTTPRGNGRTRTDGPGRTGRHGRSSTDGRCTSTSADGPPTSSDDPIQPPPSLSLDVNVMVVVLVWIE